MNTTTPLFVVLVIGVAGAMLAGSGFTDAWGAPAPETGAAQEQLNESADSVSPNSGPVEGPVSSGESSIVGLVVSGVGSLVDIGGAIVLLPSTLMGLGFPEWFSVPLGNLARLLGGVGLIEFATNREWT